ncbi:TPA: hypothetical protein N0F65_001163 [Lagenidium giganteum]|uniref:C2H2-type domain-containing protein n=1 Tax=Lagenidium giganteum TaxID=4803 RepID=A0AAV2YUW3_9STRA|nr:TPA: hypothetical protein N0F65_001163 [Lagenidium giganteum]
MADDAVADPYGGARRRTGYDEFEGIFGPVGRYRGPGGRQTSVHDARARSFFRTRGSKARFRSMASVANQFDQRARFLRQRQQKRRQVPFDPEVGDDDDDSDGGAEVDGAMLAAERSARQIWLPTQDFSFRQRAGKLDTRTIARLDLREIIETTDIDTIQRHLENLAFSDVTLEDVQQYSDAYFLKLFQIAQLTLEYLLNVQESLVRHSENLETQCESLLDECKEIEAENNKMQTEMTCLKKEIKHKQNTIATFELMLLQSSVQRQRTFDTDKENILSSSNLAREGAEEGHISLAPVSCILCGKKFVSAEYLVRHQTRKHADVHSLPREKKKSAAKRQDSSSSSDSSASSTKAKSKSSRRHRLPKEVTQALEEKNNLARNLLLLQEQLQSEKDARRQESMQMQEQQKRLNLQLTDYMSNLQASLAEIEKKTEAGKQDMLRFAQETITQTQNEASNATTMKKRSHAGALQSDDEEELNRKKEAKEAEDRRSNEKWERMMEAFLRAQADKQQEIDDLEHENRKLAKKHARMAKKKSRSIPATALMQIATLEAQRFGTDQGEVPEPQQPSVIPAAPPVPKRPVSEDKQQQTDEDEKPKPKQVILASQEVQTDAIEDNPAAVKSAVVSTERKAIVVKQPAKPTELSVSEPSVMKSEPTSVEPAKPTMEEKMAPPAPAIEATPTEVLQPRDTRFQHAAHAVGKVALGFLTRTKLKRPENWIITSSVKSLETVLSPSEMAGLVNKYHQHKGANIHIEVESGMTANELRLAVATALSIDDATTDGSLSMDYHRVLLHHRHTGEEMHGDVAVHQFKNLLEIEIIPFQEEMERHVSTVFDVHEAISGRLEEIKRASKDFAGGELLRDDMETNSDKLRKIVRFQAVVRRFLAKRKVDTMKVDQLIEARLVKMMKLSTNSASRKTVTAPVTSGQATEGSIDPRDVARHTASVNERLSSTIQARLGLDAPPPVVRAMSGRRRAMGLPTDAYDRHVRDLEESQKLLPDDVQSRIQAMMSKLDAMVKDEYDPVKAKQEERRSDAAGTIQRSMVVSHARRRLKRLLEGARAAQKVESSQPKEAEPTSPDNRPSSREVESAKRSHSPKPSDVESRDAKDDERFDDQEIDALADAYERDVPEAKGDSDVCAEQHKVAAPVATLEQGVGEVKIGGHVQKAESKAEIKHEEKPKSETDDEGAGRPLTPIPKPASAAEVKSLPEPGRSPRPKTEVISPFSKTPLLSRRAMRRGSGYDNAR